MKRVLFFIAIMICAVMVTKAEIKPYATFKTIYNVRLSETTSGYDVYIDASNDEMSTTGFILTDKELPLFLKTVKDARSKYAEWSKIAKENNVTDFRKVIGTPINIDGFFMHGNDIKMASDVPFRWKFLVMEVDGKTMYVANLTSDKMVANSDKFVKGKQMYLFFKSIEEIDEFLSCIDKSKIDNYFQNKNEVEDLFK